MVILYLTDFMFFVNFILTKSCVFYNFEADKIITNLNYYIMEETNFYVNLCKVNSIFGVGTLINVNICLGNVFAKPLYVCLCEVAEVADDTTEDDWLNPQNVVNKTTVLLVDAYIEFMGLLQKIVKNPELVYTSPELLFSTIELAKTIYVTNDFIDDEMVLLLGAILSRVKNSDMQSRLYSVIKDLEIERQKMQQREVEVVVGSFFGKIPEA